MAWLVMAQGNLPAFRTLNSLAADHPAFWSSVTFLGDASYSLYLFHPLTAPAVPAVLSAIGLAFVPLSLVLCVVVAVVAASLIYRYVESPLTVGLQARLPYVRPSAPEGVTAVAP